MTSKAVASKRAVLPRASDRTKEFVKDWNRLSKSGRFNMKQLKEVMTLLINNDEPLPAVWLDHDLKGKEWKGYRECHIGGDFLLVYYLEGSGDNETVIFARIGTHADLFEN